MLKKLSYLWSLLLTSTLLFAHDASHHVPLRAWNYESDKHVEASFLFQKNDTVFLESSSSTIIKIAVKDLSEKDYSYVNAQHEKIAMLNHGNESGASKPYTISMSYLYLLLVVILFSGVFLFSFNKKIKYSAITFLIGIGAIAYGFKSKQFAKLTSTDPNTIDAAFSPFKPDVYTHWDANYFYVENNGLPDHEMMVGIASNGWQQQVPVNQCYTGSNAWSIPLNPVVAASPVNVDQTHFTRGAIAIAANGIPIFNPYTNAGVDAYLDGQLDNYGGHCGRADDYHYHIAPLFLEGQDHLPIAYALDGYAIYGDLEPDGSPMLTLDANHGHYGTSGVYHYHGTSTAPYMIGKMVGQVTEDGTAQIIPQAAATPIRPYTDPLSGAVITACTPNSNNDGYNLTYTLSGESYSVNFNWTEAGVYTYNFISPGGNTTTETYNNHTPCSFTTFVSKPQEEIGQIFISPNPVSDYLFIQLGEKVSDNKILNTVIVDSKGSVVFSKTGYQNSIDLSRQVKGQYILKLETEKNTYSKKFVIQ